VMARNGMVGAGGPVLVTEPIGTVVLVLTCIDSLVFCGVVSGLPHPHF